MLNFWTTSGIYSFVATLVLGSFVYFHNRKNPLNIFFAILALTISCWSVGSSLENMIQDPIWALWVLRGCYAFGVFLPSIFVQFTHQVTGLGRKNREWVISAYSISTMLLPFVFTDLFIKRLQIIQPYHFRISEPGPVYYLFLVFFSVTVYRVLFLMYQAVKNAIGEKRKQLQSILVAHAVAVAAGFDYFASVLGFVKFPPLDDYLIVVYLLIFAYGIVRHRAMDITTVIHKTILWLVMSCGVILPVVGLFYVGKSWLINLSVLPFALVAGALALFLIPYVRFIQPRIDHLFQRRKYDLQKVLQDFIHEVEVLKSLDELVNKLLTTISSVLYPESISVVLLDVKSGRLLRSVGLPAAFVLDEHEGFLKQMEKENKICDDSSMVEEEAKRYFNALQAKAVVPLSHDGKLLGVVNLGIKRNLKAYSASELAFLSSLETEASIALSNSLLYEEVQTMSQELRAWALELEDKVKDRTRELAKSKEEIEAAYSKLQELDRLKTQFFGNISHELRTPLTLILAPVEMMLKDKEGHLEPHQTKNLNVVRNNALRLLKLMNQLLDLIKIDAGKLELRLSQVNVRDFFREIEDSMSSLAEQKNLKLSFECEESLEGEFDRDQIEKVVMNLIYNAVKFTPEGGSIEVRARRVEDTSSST